MDDQTRARARANVYWLFARLYREGLNEETAEETRRVPGLSELVPEELLPDEEAAAFQSLFGFNVFPFASAYLESRGSLGGLVTSMCSVWRDRCRLPHLTGEPADHIASQLEILSRLTGGIFGLDASHKVDEESEATAYFLDELVIPWLPNNPPRWPEVVEAVKKIVEVYAEGARNYERVGEWVNRIGWPRFFELTGFEFTKYDIDDFKYAGLTYKRSAQLKF